MQTFGRVVIARLPIVVAVCGAVFLMARGAPPFTLAVYGAMCGFVIGVAKREGRAAVEGGAFGLLAGLLCSFWYAPLAWLIGLPDYPPR